jgi:cytosine/adenosine deaminase-related metal-dependent hydrolase
VTRSEPPTSEAIYTRTLLGAALMLSSGTTTAVDFLYEAPAITLETLEPVVQAYRDAGLRATILLGVADLPFAESLPLDGDAAVAAANEAPPPSFESIMELAEAAIDCFHEPGGLIGIGLGPSAPQRCSPRLLEATIELARRRGVAWQTHVLETKTQALTSRDWHGESFIELMGRRDLLGPDTTLVHTVWLCDRDIELMASRGCAAVHCLLSNLRLGDGVARLPALQRAGVRVALGTDGRGCDETLDMFELAKMTALVHKVRGGEYRDWLRADEVFRMATVQGSPVAGHGQRLGRIEPGAKGDLVLIRPGSLAFVPMNDPIRQLLYGAPSRDVDTVIVDGRVAVRQGTLTGVDTEWLADRVRVHAHEALTGTATPQSLELERVVSEMYTRMDARELDVDAYLNV